MRDYSVQAQRAKRIISDNIWKTPSLFWLGGGKPKYMQTDFETYSEVDISNCGSYRYIDDETFEPLLLAVAFDDEEPFMIDLASGEEVPECVWAAIFDPEITKTAWNAQFERTIFGKMAGETLSPDSWKCTMVWSASLSLPLALKTAAQVLKTGEQKDKAGDQVFLHPMQTDQSQWRQDAESPGTQSGELEEVQRILPAGCSDGTGYPETAGVFPSARS